MEFLYTRCTLSHTVIIRSIWQPNCWKFLRTRRRPNAYIPMTSPERLLHQLGAQSKREFGTENGRFLTNACHSLYSRCRKGLNVFWRTPCMSRQLVQRHNFTNNFHSDSECWGKFGLTCHLCDGQRPYRAMWHWPFRAISVVDTAAV
jgi:hypothetical protein